MLTELTKSTVKKILSEMTDEKPLLLHNQTKQTESPKPKKQFDTTKDDLIEYDDEKELPTAVPLPGI